MRSLRLLVAFAALGSWVSPAVAQITKPPVVGPTVPGIVDSEYQSFASAHPETVGMAIIVVKNGVVYRNYKGVADKSTGAPITGTTLLAMGSITKTTTATLLARLDTFLFGELDIHDFLHDYTPIVSTMNAYDITLLDLATYRAGLPENPPPSVTDIPSLFDAIETCTDFFCFPTGAPHYSNFGFYLLGNVLAHELGGPWHDIIRTMILLPLGMADTRVERDYAAADFAARRARGHDKTGAPVEVRPIAKDYQEPSGGLWTTPYDASKWLLFNMGLATSAPEELGDLVVPYLQRPWSTNPDSRGRLAGLAWQFMPLVYPGGTTRQIMEKAGGVGGFNSCVTIVPSAATGVFVLTNFVVDKASDDPQDRQICDLPELILRRL